MAHTHTLENLVQVLWRTYLLDQARGGVGVALLLDVLGHLVQLLVQVRQRVVLQVGHLDS